MSTLMIIRVDYSQRNFEALHRTIVDFAVDFLNANRERTKPPTRQEVDWHWEEQVMRSYPDSENNLRVFLLEQKSCPAIQQFWEQRDDEKSFKEKKSWYQKTSLFYQSHRNLTEAERKTNRWAVIMTSAITGDIFVPDIRLFPLHRISYLETARKVLDANPKHKLQKHEIEDLWDGIMCTVYDYEATLWNGKKNELMNETEYRKLQKEAKTLRKRRRGEISDSSDSSDLEIQPVTTKVKIEETVVEAAEPKQEMRNSRQQAPGTLPRSRSALGDRAQSQAASELLLAESKAGTRATISNPVLQSATLPASAPPVKSPATGSNEPAVLVNRFPARGVARGTASSPSSVPLQSGHRPSTRVDGPATPIQPPTRSHNAAPARPPGLATLIPTPTRPYNAPPGRPPTRGSSSARPFSSRRPQPTPTIPQVSNIANTPGVGIAPWPYNPQTGERMNATTRYQLSTREQVMIDNGIPP